MFVQVLLAVMQALRNLAFDCEANRHKAGLAGVCVFIYILYIHTSSMDIYMLYVYTHTYIHTL